MADRKLFDIGEDLTALADLLADSDPELTDETAEAVERWFQELAGQEGEKLDSYVSLIRKFEMEESAAKAEASRYAEMAQIRNNAVKRLKNRLKDYLEFTGRTKAHTETGRTITVQANGGALPVITPPDIDIRGVPEQFVKVIRSLDLDAVREELKSGAELPFAQLGQRGTHLRIK